MAGMMARARGAFASGKLRPKFEMGRISGAMLTIEQDGDGWYVAVQWFGFVLMLDLIRAARRG